MVISSQLHPSESQRIQTCCQQQETLLHRHQQNLRRAWLGIPCVRNRYRAVFALSSYANELLKFLFPQAQDLGSWINSGSWRPTNPERQEHQAWVQHLVNAVLDAIATDGEDDLIDLCKSIIRFFAARNGCQPFPEAYAYELWSVSKIIQETERFCVSQHDADEDSDLAAASQEPRTEAYKVLKPLKQRKILILGRIDTSAENNLAGVIRLEDATGMIPLELADDLNLSALVDKIVLCSAFNYIPSSIGKASEKEPWHTIRYEDKLHLSNARQDRHADRFCYLEVINIDTLRECRTQRFCLPEPHTDLVVLAPSRLKSRSSSHGKHKAPVNLHGIVLSISPIFVVKSAHYFFVEIGDVGEEDEDMRTAGSRCVGT
jgi:hypothetical protein